MGFEITNETRDGYVYLSAVGPVTEDAIVDLGQTVRQVCEGAKVAGAVIDCAKMQGALPVNRLFYATQRFVDVVGRAISVAYINPPAEWLPSDDEFSRDVANNRGGSLQLFATETEAVAWLRADGGD